MIQQKTGAELSIPIHPALLAAIKAAPAKGVTLIGDANGRPIQRGTLTLFMRKAVVPRATRPPQGDHAPSGRKRIIG